MAGVVACAKGGGIGLSEPRLVFFGVGSVPVVARQAGASLGAGPWHPATIGAAQAALDRDLDPPADQHGGAEMKRHLARVLLARALADLDPASKGAAA